MDVSVTAAPPPATERWLDATKTCTRNLVIQRVAIAAIVLVGAAMVLVGIALFPALSGALLLAFGGSIATLSLIAFAIHFFSATNFGKVTDAQKINESVRKCEEFSVDLKTLVKYGFIEQSKCKKLVDIENMRAVLRRLEVDYFQPDVSGTYEEILKRIKDQFNLNSIIKSYGLIQEYAKKLNDMLGQIDPSKNQMEQVFQIKKNIVDIELEINRQRKTYIEKEIVPDLPDPIPAKKKMSK